MPKRKQPRRGDTRHKDVDWQLPPDHNAHFDSGIATVALLMDARDLLREILAELKQIKTQKGER